MRENHTTTKTHKRTLKLTIKKQWYDMIPRPKDEEYREIKSYYVSRLTNAREAFAARPNESAEESTPEAYKRFLEDIVYEFKQCTNAKHVQEVLIAYGLKFIDYDYVQLYNGAYYSAALPTKSFLFDGIEVGKGRRAWGAEHRKTYFIINIGRSV